MSFHFKRIRLNDWLVFGGQAEIELPDFADGQNLVVINGENGFGKTSLLRALGFVFNGRGRKSELLELWNERARKEDNGSLEVCLEFTHAGRACTIVRGADFKSRGNGVSVSPRVSLFVDGNEVTDMVEDQIEQMLPRDCLEFILFDGAEISRYARKQHEEGVRDAIEKVLGIPSVRNLRDDLAKLIDALEEEQQELLSQSQQAEELLGEVEALRDEEETYVIRRRELREKKQSLETTNTELEKEAEGIEAIERERRELDEKQRRQADHEERRSELDEQVRRAISKTPLALLGEPLRQIVEELRARQSSSPRREGHRAHRFILQELLEEEKCLCERDIPPDVRQTLADKLERIEKQLAGRPDHDATEMDDMYDLSTLLRTIESLDRDPESLIDKRAAVDTQLEEIETDIHRLRSQLEGHEIVSVNELFQQIAQINREIAGIDGQIESVDQNLERTRNNLQQKQRQLDEIGADSEQARGVTRTLEETRRLYAAVSGLVEQFVVKKREAIEGAATAIFRQITNKPEEYARLRVNGDYSLEVIRADGTVVENDKLSAGEKEVVAYSFITALNLSSVDPAPFVMDTPFGHLDSGHRAGLLRSLPRLKVQAILLATDRDLPPDERDAVDASICKEFTLVRNQRRAVTTITEN